MQGDHEYSGKRHDAGWHVLIRWVELCWSTFFCFQVRQG